MSKMLRRALVLSYEDCRQAWVLDAMCDGREAFSEAGGARVSDFEISVVIPVYNSEEYLGETLESVAAQTVGMDAVQVVIVDDGSTDGSAAICRSFQDRYPANVVFHQQPNGGVSSARNAGLDRASGRIVTCLDSDDQWTPESFAYAVDFFDNQENNVDVLVGELTLFEGEDHTHPLAYRFPKDKDSIIRLGDRPCDIQSTIGNCFFLREAIGDIRFDEDLTTSEDTLFVNRVILHKCAYAVTPFCTYLYRKRQDGSSLSQVITYSKHMQNLDVCERVLEASRRAKGRVLPFAQAVALYIIGWQLLGKASDALSAEDAANWSAAVRKIVADADADVIANARWLTREKKIVLYRLKYGVDVFKELVWVDRDRGLLDGMQLISMNAKAPCYLYEITPQGTTLHIEGTTDIDILGMPFELFVRDEKSGERFNAHLSPFPTDNRRTLAKESVCKGMRFTLDLPLEPERSFSFRARFCGRVQEVILTPHYGNFAIFSQSMKRDYHRFGGVMVKHIGKQLRTYRATWRMAVVSELRRWAEILRSKKGTSRLRFEYVWLRLCYRVHRLLFKKPIWIFGDKEWKAGDNAENVYRYAMKRSGYRGAKMYFALEKSSADYASVAKCGHVIDPTTFRYKLLFLLSSVVVSSRAEESMVNPYGPELVFVKDLMDYDFVYLTHGTLFGDLAFMLGKPAKKIKLFSVSTQMERNALLSEAYGYREDEVSLMGMARYDAYGDVHTQKKIAFLPTWRSNIAGKIIPGTSTREYVHHFKSTDFWKFYNALINDERLLDAMRRYGYTAEFYVHPAFEKQAGDFQGNELVQVGEGSADYERVLSESALMVTDYSGVGFDFGYQRKPVVYSQYDSVFSGGHTYGEDSYFDYDIDGFGPVTRTLEETVDAIIRYMENDCQMEPEYRSRADAMFGFSDYESSKRIFEGARALSERRRADGCAR